MNMHRTYRTLVALVCLVLLVTLGALPIGAEEDKLSQNRAAASEAIEFLNGLITHYDEKDAPTKTPADQAIRVISDYQSEISDLVYGDMSAARAEDLRADIVLLQDKGALTAKLAWIAYRHGAIEADVPEDSVYAQYTALAESVRVAVDSSTVSSIADTVCIAMNQTVFKQRIHRLSAELGIAEVHILDHIKQARIEIDATLSPDIDGTPYLAIYERTRSLIVLEQARLAAKEEFSAVYDLLGLPSAGKLPALGLLSSSLIDATSIAEVNSALFHAVSDCVQTALPTDGIHTTAYRNALERAMSEAVTRAESKAVVALTPYLDGSDASLAKAPFSLLAKIALAKDRVEALRLPTDDAALFNLLNTYVQADGILDACQTADDLDREVLRATYRADWARKKPLYLSRIEEILPTASSGNLVPRVKAVYTEIDEEICSLSVDAMQEATLRAALDTLLEDGICRLEDLACEARAERFRIAYADVLSQADASLITRAQLEEAIESFDLLSSSTQKKLSMEKLLLGEHYKRMIAAEIFRYRDETGAAALRSESLSPMLARVTSLSPADLRLTDLQKHADEALFRAVAMDALLDHYAKICAHVHYAQYDSDSVTLLGYTVQNALQAFGDPTKTSKDGTDGRKTISSLLEETLLELDRRAAIAELRLAAADSPIPSIKELLQSTTQGILQASDVPTVVSLRDAAIFRIAAYRKADAMREELKELESAITALRALTDVQKQSILNSSAMQALVSDCTQAENAPDLDALTAVAASFARDKQALLADAEKASLCAGVEQALREIVAEGESIRARLQGYVYLTSNERQAFLERLDTLISHWQIGMQTPSMTWELLDTRLLEIRESLMGLLASAQAREEAALRSFILEDLNVQYARSEAYSDAHYKSILALLEEAEILLDNTIGIDGLNVLKATLEQRLDAIPTRLDEAKATAKENLSEVYANLQKRKICYSEKAWQSIEEIYRNTWHQIETFSLISDTSSVLNIATKESYRMQQIRMERLYSHEVAIGEDGSILNAYPVGYDIDASGPWATISAPDAIPFDGRFSITRFDASHLTDTLQDAVRRSALLSPNGDTLSAAELSSLRHAIITDGLTILCSLSPLDGASYRVSLLLPEEYDVDNILGIAFIREDESIEFYNYQLEKNIISFDISHFSDFYIVSKKTIDLSPLILVLALILLCEIAVILMILSRRKARVSQDQVSAWMPIAPFAASVRILPQGGLVAVVILGLCIIVATITLIWLILDERTRYTPTPAAALESPKEAKAELSLSEHPLEIDTNPLSEIPALYEPLPTVTAELANAMMSDDEVKHIKESTPRRESVEIARPVGKKYAVNIDVISKKFEPYDTVSLSSLKKHGLVPQSTKAIKILGRGTLDKPLTIVANDFSATAIKMILLTGGEAIPSE